MKALHQINQLNDQNFSNFVGSAFEGSPWFSNRLWTKQPFESLDDMRTKIHQVLIEATPDEQLALIKSHPDLGSRAKMTPASQREQEGAGLQSLSSESFNKLQSLNQDYQERFDFPFILAVDGKTVSQITHTLETRLEQTVEHEKQEALHQIAQIVFGRIRQIITEE